MEALKQRLSALKANAATDAKVQGWARLTEPPTNKQPTGGLGTH